MDTINYRIFNPTQNITILVNEPIAVERQPEVAEALLSLHPEAEQVGFVSISGGSNDIELRMAAGEFCGNATMSTAAFFGIENGMKAGDVKDIMVSASGTDMPVKVRLKCLGEEFEGSVYMPLPIKIEEVNVPGLKEKIPAVDFGGIVHLIAECDLIDEDFHLFGQTKFTRMECEELIKRWCTSLNAPGLGIMFVKEDRLVPLVYVPGVNTVIWESSCASGTTAAGAHLAHRINSDASFSFKEPGGILKIEARKGVASKEEELILTGHVRMC